MELEERRPTERSIVSAAARMHGNHQNGFLHTATVHSVTDSTIREGMPT